MAVFPAIPDGKRPLTEHGFLDASTDLGQIRAWWHEHPLANLAVPTGTNFADVLDVDVHETGSGYAALNKVNRAGLLVGYERIIATPAGGLHIYFAGTSQPGSRLPDMHIDFKATGGYVIAPPSVVGGRPYERIRRSRETPEALNWPAVRNLLAPTETSKLPRNPRETPAGIEALAAWVARLPEGQRNSGTFWAACRAAEQGITDLDPLIVAATQAGLTTSEAVRTVASAVRHVTGVLPPSRSSAPALPHTRPGRRP